MSVKLPADEKTQAFDAFFDLNKEARELELSYRDSISRGFLTVISASLAVIGFLVNAKHTQLLLVPQSTVFALTLLWAGFGLAYVSNLYHRRVFAACLGHHSELIRNTFLGESEKAKGFETKRDGEERKLKVIGIATDAFSIAGIAGLVWFAYLLINNIATSHIS